MMVLRMFFLAPLLLTEVARSSIDLLHLQNDDRLINAMQQQQAICERF